MRAFAFVYSRTKNHDYRVLADLSEEVCPSEVRDCFKNRIVAISNDADSSKSFKWLFFKEKGYVLWGLACMNEMLDSSYSKDKFLRAIRGFTGYMIPNYSGEPLANDINVFKEIFRTVMAPIFDSFVQEQSTDVLVDVSNAASFIHPKPFDSKLNKDYHLCRIFSSTVDAESLVASCLSCPSDISIAMNVARIESVTTPRFNPLMNAVMRDAMPEEINDIPVEHLCDSCGKEVYDLKEGLCQDCWDKQHPRCRRCEKETSQLRDGLCQNCYDIEHPHCYRCGRETFSLQDGLCMDCYNEANIFCPKCGRKVSALTSKGVCEECERRKRLRTWLYYGAVVLILLVLFAVNKCHRGIDPKEPESPVPERIIPEMPQPQQPLKEMPKHMDTGIIQQGDSSFEQQDIEIV